MVWVNAITMEIEQIDGMLDIIVTKWLGECPLLVWSGRWCERIHKCEDMRNTTREQRYDVEHQQRRKAEREAAKVMAQHEQNYTQ